MMMRSLVFGVFSFLVMMGCSNDDNPTPIAGPVALGFGEVTSAVVIVNPVINRLFQNVEGIFTFFVLRLHYIYISFRSTLY